LNPNVIRRSKKTTFELFPENEAASEAYRTSVVLNVNDVVPLEGFESNLSRTS
jgi:hypothetical protein